MSKRYLIVGVTAVAAMWLYIDRVCFSTLADAMKRELLLPLAPEPSEGDALSPEEIAAAKKKKRDEDPTLGDDMQLSPEEIVAAKKKKWADKRMSYALGAFFFTYALFQIPMGTLADRFGARKVLALSIAAWSLVTMATGFVGGFLALLGIRLMLGITEAGAYPAAAGLIKSWAKPEERGRFSSVVAFGGRVGGAVAPWLTAALATGLVGVAVVEWVITPTPAPPGPDGKPPPNWRGVFVVYGLCGLAVAGLFWLIVRDRPSLPSPRFRGEGGGARQDRAASAASEPTPGEGALNQDSPSPPTPLPETGARGVRPPLTFFQRIGLLARTRNMWLFGGVQFGVNLGWAFVVTLLPTYLNEAFGIPLKEIGPMQSTALTIGCVGMVFGGFATDALRRRFGPRLGRSVPIAVTLGGCALVFFLAPGLPSAWAVVIALGVMAFLVDLHNPSIWSFAQDVGGKNVGAALGWGNMWGNLGAALSPVLITEIRLAAGWSAAFVFCGFAFAAAAVCGLLLDATKPVDTNDAG
jgi:MFS transporter, ACS family, glucarate transporter